MERVGKKDRKCAFKNGEREKKNVHSFASLVIK